MLLVAPEILTRLSQFTLSRCSCVSCFILILCPYVSLLCVFPSFLCLIHSFPSAVLFPPYSTWSSSHRWCCLCSPSCHVSLFRLPPPVSSPVSPPCGSFSKYLLLEFSLICTLLLPHLGVIYLFLVFLDILVWLYHSALKLTYCHPPNHHPPILLPVCCLHLGPRLV